MINRFFFQTLKMKITSRKKRCCLHICSSIDHGYTLEPPRRGGSNEYPQSTFWTKNKKKKKKKKKKKFIQVSKRPFGPLGYNIYKTMAMTMQDILL